jgi:hypothetical protein
MRITRIIYIIKTIRDIRRISPALAGFVFPCRLFPNQSWDVPIYRIP